MFIENTENTVLKGDGQQPISTNQTTTSHLNSLKNTKQTKNNKNARHMAMEIKSERESDFCFTPTQHLISYIMARTC